MPSTTFFSFIYDLIDFNVYVQSLLIAQLIILYDFKEFNVFCLYWLHPLCVIIVLIWLTYVKAKYEFKPQEANKTRHCTVLYIL